MNRTTRAMARLGALAVVAGTVLSAPFATGIANAAVTLGAADNAAVPFSSFDGTVTDQATAATFGTGDADANFTVTGAGAGDTLTLKIVGSTTAYFPTAPGAAGSYASAGGTTATCAADGTGACYVEVADTKSESVNISVVDTSASPAASEVVTVKFNSIHFTTPACPQNDVDSFANCATQAQTNVPITVTVQYLEAGTGPSGKTLHALLNQNAKFSGTQPAGTTVDSDQAAHCITTNGNCSFTIVDAFATDAGVGVSVFIQNADASPYPGTSTFGFGNAGARAKASLQLSSHSVAPARVNLVAAQLLTPTPQQTNAAQNFAEPGDVYLEEFYVTAACAPQAGNQDCEPSNGSFGDPTDDGTFVADTSFQVTVDHGFFTPVCSPGAPTDPDLLTVLDYADCSFATTPTAGTPVGNLTNSGQTITVSTDESGTFVVAVAIGKDSAFDQGGLVSSHVTVGGLSPVLDFATGGHLTTTPGTVQTCPSSYQILGGVAVSTVNPPLPGPPTQGIGSCKVDLQFTTAEQPLNGGTAKLVGIPALSQPNNTAIITENNISASDSGTVNVPDVDRVVFVIHETDQFGNLTSGALSMGNAEGALTPTLVKTGPDTLYGCTGFTTVDPCTNGITGPPGITNSAQPDGTTTQTATGVIGSYTNFVQDSLNPGAMPNGQIRGQVDNATAAIPAHPAGFNDGWGTATAGVNDGTTVLTLTWSAPTTTFTTFVVGPPNAASYGTGTAAAATDTFTLNFYNQLAQPVITFTVKPGSTVQTGTAVTVEATVKDQFGNPIVLQPVDAVRSGANESTCVPAQGVNNGGNVNNALFTNTSGVTGYTFTCTGAGVSNVSMVVLGPGNTQLAQGREAITFTGSNVGGGQKKEKPTLRITSPKKHVLVLHVATHPSLNHVTVHFYKVVHGLKILVGGAKTGGAGHAHLKIGGLKSGSTHRYTVKVVKLSNKYKSVFAKSRAHKVS